LVLTATLLAVLLFEIVASREAAAFLLGLGDRAPEPDLEPGSATVQQAP
jgi:hypothetical protein